MLILYILFVTLLFVAGWAYAVYLIRREQAKSRVDRNRLELQDTVLQEKTFPALEAAGQAVESSQNLIFAIQQSITEKGRS